MLKKRYLFFPMLFMSLANAEIQNSIDAVNTAGKQRMLSQLMMKNYVMIGSENFLDNPYESLEASIEDFSNNLDDLITYNITTSKDKKILAKLNEIKKEWEEDKKLFIPEDEDEEDEESEDEESEDEESEDEESEDEESDDEDDEVELTLDQKLEAVVKLQNKIDTLLKLSDDATVMFSKLSGTSKNDNVINISTKQRMLSQRMASLYLMKAWGVKNDKVNEKLNKAISDFENGLNELKKYPKNTKETKKLIKNSERSLLFFKVMNMSSTKYIPSLIFKKSNIMLKDMEKITKIYITIEGGN